MKNGERSTLPGCDIEGNLAVVILSAGAITVDCIRLEKCFQKSVHKLYKTEM